MFPFSLFPMFPLRALCFIISLSRTPQFPLDPILLSSLRLLRSCTRIPLWRIRSLVYIFHVLVLYNLELILLVSPRISLGFLRNARKLWFGSSRLKSPLVSLSYFWHAFWWGQSIAVHRTRLLAFLLVCPDPVGSECNNELGKLFQNPQLTHNVPTGYIALCPSDIK